MWISQSAFDQATDEMSSESTNDASQCDSCNQRLAEDRFSFVFCFCFFLGGGGEGEGEFAHVDVLGHATSDQRRDAITDECGGRKSKTKKNETKKKGKGLARRRYGLDSAARLQKPLGAH